MEETQKEIPGINYSDNKVVLKTKEVPFMFNDEKIMLKMQELPSEERGKIVDVIASTKIVGTQTQATIQTGTYQIKILAKVIVEAPFPIDEATIGSFPGHVLDYLYEEYSSWAQPKKKV